VVRDAGSARPLLLLITPTAPPVLVKGYGGLPVGAAIGLYLEPVLARTSGLHTPLEDLLARIPHTVAWITWNEVQAAVATLTSTRPLWL
jgi:predicted benzoate:H+ symporter BenE